MTDWAVLYRDHVDAVSALASDLTDEQLATSVPGTPAWTVRDVLAHMAGGPADVLTGRMDDAPGPEWTSRHVSERTHLPVADLVDELRTNCAAVGATTVDNPRPAVVWDIAVHHADLHEGLGLGRLPERFWLPVVEMVGPWRAPELVDVVAPYELFRVVFSRRSRAQMEALGVPPDRLDDVCVFGARDDDQPVPA
jgi:Mycothiol maleylpyruvate isomerase N-terminal domain